MRWFAERFTGWIIRIGPDAYQRPDPYLWALPLSDHGEFVGVSTKRLNSEAVRVATQAAKSLGFEVPHWLHKEKIMTHKHAKHGDGKKPDGTLDQTVVQSNVAEYLDAMKSGKVQILAVGDPLPVPGMDGVSAKTFLIKE